MTLVCVSILVRRVESALADAEEAKRGGADLVEFRIDEFFGGELESPAGEDEVRGLLRLVGGSALPCIVTCRRAEEGGAYDGSEEARVSLLERLGVAGGAGEHPPRYFDIELAAFERSANIRQKIGIAAGRGAGLILSVHDAKGRPEDLWRRVERLRRATLASVVKVAYRARSLRDSLELLELPRQIGMPAIALGMGEFGVMSRVLAPKFGGFLTFASLREESVTAPGQPTLRELLGMYRFRRIGRGTRVYGVVGWPVGHSRSPLVHNAAFERAGVDAVYLPMAVAADGDGEASYASFKGTMLELIGHEGLGFSGCSVTMPHKENLVRLARERRWELDEASSTIGAGNTLVRRGASWSVHNTDGEAIAGLLRETMDGLEGGIRGARVAVLGAGGAGRAAANSCARSGAGVAIWSRSEARARRAAEELTRGGVSPGTVEAVSLEEVIRGRFDVVVHATPRGMNDDGAVLTAGELLGCVAGGVVMETVYAPARTTLIERAHEAGCAVIDGLSVFARQAEMQSELFTGVHPGAGVFEGLVRG